MALPLGRPVRWPRHPSRPSSPAISSRRLSCSATSATHPKFKRPYTTVLIVPTGVGASIGGFAGDALPVARTLASVADCLISHPNVLNAAMLYWPMPNSLYVEGYALDRFAEGYWALQPVHQNKVGLVLDAGIEEELRIRHLQVADATRASLGLPVIEYVVTDTPLKVETWIDPRCGKSTGRIDNSDSLLRAVDSLVNHSEVNAVAVVGRFPDYTDDLDNYRQGKGVDLLAGLEAIISHLIVKEFKIPSAHAPALLPLHPSTLLSPKSAAEEIGYTFLPCVLAGLSSAPQYVMRKQGSSDNDCIVAGDVDSVVLPFNACGGDAALAFARSTRKNKPLIITVQENETVLDDTPDKLGIEAVNALNYWEAIGIIAAHKAGVNPRALRREGVDNLRSPSQLYSDGFIAECFRLYNLRFTAFCHAYLGENKRRETTTSIELASANHQSKSLVVYVIFIFYVLKLLLLLLGDTDNLSSQTPSPILYSSLSLSLSLSQLYICTFPLLLLTYNHTSLSLSFSLLWVYLYLSTTMRKRCCDKDDKNYKGAWSRQEDQKLLNYILTHGEGCWRSVPKAAGLQRCGKSCRLRWINYLRPDVKRGNFAEDEEDLIIKLHALLGNRWSLIAGRLPGRTDNEVKNYWNSHLRRKLMSMGINPNKHRVTESLSLYLQQENSKTDELSTKCSMHHGCMDCKILYSPTDDDRVSDATSCIEDNGRMLPDLNLDLTISTSSPPSIFSEKKDIKEVEATIELEKITIPTLVLFR
ncbi:uncharacterized protein [Typha latifolia]|uniref:uncharacterized protein n=1 Tax=Typha latifolia TaxID=4733 RepID=UPI003C2D1EF1